MYQAAGQECYIVVSPYYFQALQIFDPMLYLDETYTPN
jgi:hypothetical protein